MDDHITEKDHYKLSSKKRHLLMLIFLLPLILATVFIVFYLYWSDTFRPEPKVEIQPENKFAKTLHVVTDEDYAPYSFIDAQGE